MSERHYRLYLADILDSGHAVQSCIQGLEFERFRNDRMRCTAVIREFEIVGEAVGRKLKTKPVSVKQESSSKATYG